MARCNNPGTIADQIRRLAAENGRLQGANAVLTEQVDRYQELREFDRVELEKLRAKVAELENENENHRIAEAGEDW